MSLNWLHFWLSRLDTFKIPFLDLLFDLFFEITKYNPVYSFILFFILIFSVIVHSLSLSSFSSSWSFLWSFIPFSIESSCVFVSTLVTKKESRVIIQGLQLLKTLFTLSDNRRKTGRENRRDKSCYKRSISNAFHKDCRIKKERKIINFCSLNSYNSNVNPFFFSNSFLFNSFFFDSFFFFNSLYSFFLSLSVFQSHISGGPFDSLFLPCNLLNLVF